MNNPILSVVIANYNYGRFLEDAIKSVIDQRMGDKIELIICDAKSTDNSVEIIKKYAEGLPPSTDRADWLNADGSHAGGLISWWCSEKDGGQSAAFNKGFAHARGRFLTWLNADDILLPGALMRFMTALKTKPDCRWFVGGVMWLDENLRIIKCGRGRPFSSLRAKMGNINVWGPSSIFAKELFYKAGGMDERFSFSMDTDLWLRFHFLCGEKYLPFADYAWGFRVHEQSKTASRYTPNVDKEKEAAKRKKIMQEIALREKKTHIPQSKSWFKLLISISYIKSIQGRIDTLRLHGKRYEEYFQTHS